MKGFEKLIARKRKFGGYDVAEDVDFARTVAHVVNPAFTDDLNKEIAEKIAAALNDDTYVSEDDLKELEALAKRVEDRSEYGGGLILALVNMYRNVKAQPEVAQ